MLMPLQHNVVVVVVAIANANTAAVLNAADKKHCYSSSFCNEFYILHLLQTRMLHVGNDVTSVNVAASDTAKMADSLARN